MEIIDDGYEHTDHEVAVETVVETPTKKKKAKK